MVKDQQVRMLMKHVKTETDLPLAAAKAGMCEKTARKYVRSGKLPSECAVAHTWRTREDAFEAVWPDMVPLLETNPGLEAKTLFEEWQRRFPGVFQDSQLRTLQRRLKRWRALEGPSQEVFFAQEHHPGVLCQSDFTHMESLDVTIGGQPLAHLVYHFVLTYSNWETGSVCFSESFESLSSGLQGALFELGGVPASHQSDRLSAAVCNLQTPAAFTEPYLALVRHYGLEARMIQAAKANENGDVEQRHHRFKRAVDQALMLRGSRDFADRAAYETFLKKLLGQLNAGRRERLAQELARLRALPLQRLDSFKKLRCRVGQGSTIALKKNVYSVPSRLIGEQVEVRLHAEHLEVWYAQKKVETIERLRGCKQHRVNYRHVIDWLVRKPGAFANYRYREDLFPTSRFRMALDALERQDPQRGHKQYLKILQLSARESQTRVDEALRTLIDTGQAISFEMVEAMAQGASVPATPVDVHINTIELESYDALFDGLAFAGREMGQ